jgi:hypothetical protein
MTMGTRWAGWRAWRRTRPFWGGLLLVLAGLELLAIPLSGILIHGAVKLVIYIGIGGVFGVLIGVLLIAAGIMLWVNATHRMFYGVAGIALGIVSFPASNLGGFFLGMLLAIIGGSIGFAWTPAQAPPVPAAPDVGSALGEPTAGFDDFDGLDVAPVTDAEPVTEAEPVSDAESAAEAEPVNESAAEAGPVSETELAREGEPAAELSAGTAAR